MIINIKEVIDQLESMRNSKNLSMEKMADLCHMGSKSTYSELIKRGNGLKLDYLIYASDAFGFSLSDFFRKFEKPNGSVAAEPESEYYIRQSIEKRVEMLERKFELMKLSRDIAEFQLKLREEGLEE